ncbi:MAG: hypothetical protein JWO03_1196 [Bacteroidetes bacterium]|nr:hypothetical protein [Bacteroidota bacterium]
MLFSIGLCATVCAQTGIYMTYDDFKAGKLIKSDDNKIDIKIKHEVALKVGGEKKEYQTKDFFAMLWDGELYRFSPTSVGNIYLKLTTVSDNYALWGYSETRSYSGGSHSNSVIYYVSKGLGGKMTDISTNGQLKALEGQSDFKDLVDCIKKGKKLALMHPLMMAAGECIYADPTYKKDPKSVVPAIK